MSLRALATAAAASFHLLPFASGNPFPLQARDLLTPLGASSTSEQLKWSPALDYDTDSCYNVAAISSSGQLNAGQDPGKGQSEIIKYCRKEDRLTKTNVYVRSRCNNGWCAHMYDYYFESDFTNSVFPGHRHDWEHIAVWTQNGNLQFVSISAHGEWDIRLAGRNPQIRYEQGTHPKVVYHKDGQLTHAFRYANSGDERPENHWKSWRGGHGAGLIEG